MKRKIITAAISALGFWSVATSAAPITHTLSINATVDPGCTTAVASGTTGFTTNGNSSTFTTAVTGTSTAPSGGSLTFGTLVCTTANVRVTLASARMGLYIDGTQGLSSQKRMHYVATLKLNGSTLVTLDTHQGTTPSPAQGPLASGTNSIVVQISFPHTGSALLPEGTLTAGTYKDTITIGIDGAAI